MMMMMMVSDVFLSFDGKLFHTDGPAAEKLCGSKLIVLVFGVAKLPALADRRCRRVASVRSDLRYTGGAFEYSLPGKEAWPAEH